MKKIKMNNLISIVMLTYNNFEKFVRCMSTLTLFISDERIKEIIVLDNGSHQPELKKFLETMDVQIKKFRVIFSDVNLGIAKGRKLLYDISEGDYIISIDSDVVFINPISFLDVFYKTLDLEGMMLVGGGGGDHPFFPSMERENINNYESPKSPNEIKIVDEVAGWFHGFKSSILKKNGGFLEMDEQFSPFWAEDSDICVQIKLAGGKCSIMGQGLIAHQWSSCDKKEIQTTLEEMWYKFQDKWYSQFGEDFKFEINDQFYKDNYPESSKFIRLKEHYLKIGMIKGNFHSKSCIHYLFPDVAFVKNDKIKYECEEVSLEEFHMKYFTMDNIIKDNFRIIDTSMPKEVEDLTFLILENTIKGMEIIKSMISFQKLNLVLCVDPGTSIIPFLNLFRKYEINYIVCSFPYFHHDLISYVSIFPEIIKLVKSKRCLNLSTLRDCSLFTENKISDFKEGICKKEDLLGIDKVNLSIINEFISLNSNMKWNKSGCFLEETNHLLQIFSSVPVKEILIRCLKIPQKYSNHISPRCAPKYALERIIGYVREKLPLRKSLTVVVANINNKEDYCKIKNNISYIEDSKIVLVNTGELRNIDLFELKCNHYYPVSGEIDDIKCFMVGINSINLKDYSNIIFMNDSYKISSSIDDFTNLSKYKNCILIEKIKENNREFDKNIFSIVSSDLIPFIEECKKENVDLDSIMKKMNFVSIWEEKSEEEEEEIIISYRKRGKDDGRDFPIL